MGIDIAVVNDGGHRYDVLLDDENILFKLVASNEYDVSSTDTLRFIDHYGNTVFNRVQIPYFINDLRSISSTLTNRESDFIKRVVALAESTSDHPHRYLKFYGE